MHFADRLNDRINALNSRIVIGIDPHPERLFQPESKFKKAFPSKPEEYLLDAFCSTIIETAKTKACAIKPQAAFFESMGLWGLKALSSCIREARKQGIPVILDAKRGDIGTVASAYAKAYLDPRSDFFADALTVNPYLGPDTLIPFASLADEKGCGLFVLVRTTNPGSSTFQDLTVEVKAKDPHQTVAGRIALSVNGLGRENIGKSGFSNIGAVVGATYPQHFQMIRQAMPQAIFLVPGYGAQGGKSEDVKPAFYPGGTGAIISSSRGIIFSYEAEATHEKVLSPETIYAAMSAAAEKARNDVNSVAI